MEKIAMFLASMRGGGAERIMMNLAHGFIDKGLPVDMVLVNAEGPYLTEISNRVRIINLQSRRTLLALPKLIRYLKREKPSHLLSALDHANITAMIAKKIANSNTKLFVTIHNTLSQDLRNTNSSRFIINRFIIPRLLNPLYPYADGVIAVSHGVAEDLQTLAPKIQNNLHVIYNPVVSDRLIELSNSPITDLWGRSDFSNTIISVGRLTRQKNYQELIRAFAIVRNSIPEARLLIIGEGTERQQLENLIKQLHLENSVALPGFVQNPYAYMAKASVFALSSTWEGLPTVLVEALACGTQLVSTDCKSGPSEILDNGRLGRLVPVNDEKALAKAIIETLINPIVSSEDLQSHSQQFSMESITERYLEVMNA